MKIQILKNIRIPNIIELLSIIFMVAIIAPLLYVLKNIFIATDADVLLSLVIESIVNTLVMAAISGLFAVLLGSSLAWIINVYEFKGRRLFQILMVLPFGIPPYIMAQTYADLSSFTGFIPAFFRNNFQISTTIDVMNIKGAIFVYTFSLFPYVFFLCSSFYNTYAGALVDNSRLLGVTGWKMFTRIGFKVARLPIIASVSLVCMEIISDYGVVSYFGIPAFTTIFYKIWTFHSDFASAIKIAAILMFITFIILTVERYISSRKRFYSKSVKSDVSRLEPTGGEKWFIYTYLILVIIFALILPLAELLYNNYYVFAGVISLKYIGLVLSTVAICLTVGILAVIMSNIMVNYICNSKGILAFLTKRVATLGYSVPGIIIAIAVMFTFRDLDRLFRPIYVYTGIQDKLLLSHSVFILVFAHVVRFITIAFNQLSSNRNKFNPHLFEASRLLGKSQFATFIKIDIRLLKDSSIVALLLVFLDVLKELPITMLLKPTHINTLTTEIFKFYDNEMIKESSVPCLFIVVIGMMLSVLIDYYRRKKTES